MNTKNIQCMGITKKLFGSWIRMKTCSICSRADVAGPGRLAAMKLPAPRKILIRLQIRFRFLHALSLTASFGGSDSPETSDTKRATTKQDEG
jgi:hypothetical protein